VVALAAGCSASDSSATLAHGGSTSNARATDKDAGIELGTRKLELTSNTSLKLGFGAQSHVRGRLLDDAGKPLAGEHVSFALLGRPLDSAVAELDAQTDDSGAFVNTLIAGKSDATFRVRVSSEGAYDAFVDVGVSNAGFGTLVVTASYGGDRMVQQRSVFAQAGVDCKDAARMSGDPMATFAGGDAQATLPALPAGTKYAVTVVAESGSGTVVAQGCVDGVTIESDMQTPVEIQFKDSALMSKGEFALTATLDATLPASALSAVLRSAEEAAIVGDTPGQPAPPDAEARFLLDSLDYVLRSKDFAGATGVTTLAKALASDRMQAASDATPDHTLQSQLELNSQGALAAVALVAMLSQADLEAMRIEGALSLGSSVTFQPERIVAVPVRPKAADVAVDLTKTKATTDARLLSNQDALELSSVRFDAQLGALASQVASAVMSTTAPGRGADIRSTLGCKTLGEWLGQQKYATAAACGKDCLAAACERAASRLLDAADTALSAEDDARPALTLSSTLALHDENGDLIAEKLTGDTLSGEWLPASGSDHGDALSGSVTASATGAQ
jgi:hypothetical protein